MNVAALATLERVGEDTARRVDVRVITATKRELFDKVEAGRFRRGLYFRLCVFPLRMPPLRDRSGDIRVLAEHFAQLASRRLKIPHGPLTESNVELLASYRWPGNVRELQNVGPQSSQAVPLWQEIAAEFLDPTGTDTDSFFRDRKMLSGFFESPNRLPWQLIVALLPPGPSGS